jgi:phage terminase large subunit-like protein
VASINEHSFEEKTMKSSMSGVAILVAAVCSVAVAAQSGAMAKGDTMSKMEMKDTTYTGCIEAGSTDGSFMLMHLSGDDHMAKEMMKSGAMKNDSMAKDTMDAMDAMEKDTMSKPTSTLTVKSLKMVAASCS